MTRPPKDDDTCVNKDRRENDAQLAVALEEWKHFSIMKFDENAKALKDNAEEIKDSRARLKAIEDKQDSHLNLLQTNTALTLKLGSDLGTMQSSIGDVLSVVTALSGTKKTFTWLGKFTLWVSSLVGAVTLVRAALTSPLKWPW